MEIFRFCFCLHQKPDQHVSCGLIDVTVRDVSKVTTVLPLIVERLYIKSYRCPTLTGRDDQHSEFFLTFDLTRFVLFPYGNS